MFDAHNHLHFAAFDDDREGTLARARDAGVDGMILADFDSERRSLAAELSERPGIWATAGLHPWAVKDEDQARRELELLENLDWSPFCALGELGLDWVRAKQDEARALQRSVFRRQLAIARERDLPLVIHCVRADDEVASILERDGAPGRGGILHSFWGSARQAERFVRLGFALSIGTQITKSSTGKTIEAVRTVGLDHLLVETDAPSRPPQGVASDRNEPAYLPCVVEALALVLGADRGLVAERTAENARRVFDLVDERLQ